MIPANEIFDGTFPFEPHFFDALGFRMHYVDEGKGEPIICLHGEPTWGYIYRKFIPPLSKTHRVIVPDYMGFGKSETPQDKEYTLRTHVENLAALIEELDLQSITFVAQDWGGPVCGAYTIRHPERVKRFCLMNTLLSYSPFVKDAPKLPPLHTSPWFTWIAEGLKNGSYYEVMGNLGTTILSVMKLLGFENLSVVDKTWINAYSSPFENKGECKGAIEFPLDVAERRIIEYVKEGASGIEELRKKEAMLVDGLNDHAIPPERAIMDFKTLFPKGPAVELENVGHFCQEDAPETLVALIQQFIQMT
ncbi:MAG TPA: alpha/beta fold hydrolase [Thermodesulfobacteriota bacterium]|nr:alpha/beta fold hydrolase [Thermodesulfobacteriota bacterium]